MKNVHSFSPEETREIGREVAAALRAAPPIAAARVLALRGDLGAGKTTFVQGLFRGFGVRRRPISPTFVIMRRYRIPVRRGATGQNQFSLLYHFDAYRLRREEDAAILGFDAILADPKNVVLVEWPENIKGILPRSAWRIGFAYGKKESERIISGTPIPGVRGNK